MLETASSTKAPPSGATSYATGIVQSVYALLRQTTFTATGSLLRGSEHLDSNTKTLRKLITAKERDDEAVVKFASEHWMRLENVIAEYHRIGIDSYSALKRIAAAWASLKELNPEAVHVFFCSVYRAERTLIGFVPEVCWRTDAVVRNP